jgi:hypothetical protein
MPWQSEVTQLVMRHISARGKDGIWLSLAGANPIEGAAGHKGIQRVEGWRSEVTSAEFRFRILLSAGESSTMSSSYGSQGCGCTLVRTCQVCDDFEAEKKCRFATIPTHLPWRSRTSMQLPAEHRAALPEAHLRPADGPPGRRKWVELTLTKSMWGKMATD